MAREKEIKILLKINLDDFLKRVRGKGYNLQHVLNQRDIYFDTKDWYLYENLAALRLRQVDNNDYSFSFKKIFYLPDKENKYYIEEIEIKTPFDNPQEFEKIFSRLQLPYHKETFKTGDNLREFLIKNNYYDEQVMLKIRKVYSKNGNELVVDDVDKVGTIVELECPNDEPLHLVKEFLNEDEWIRDVEGTSYLWLKKFKGLNSHLKNLKRFEKVHDWNVWENEREMYSEIQKD